MNLKHSIAPITQVWLVVAIAVMLQCFLNSMAYFELFPDIAGKSLNGAAKNSAYLINGSLALLACWYFDGRRGMLQLFRPYTRVCIHLGWWVLAIGIMVPVLFLSLYLNDLLSGQPLTTYSFQLSAFDNFVQDAVIFAKVAISDELFWIGFVYPRLLVAGFSPLKASLVMGVCWGMQYVPFIFTGFLVAPGINVDTMILGWFAITPIYVWFYHKTGSALLLVVFNVSMQFAYSAVPVLPGLTGDNNVLAMANLVTFVCGVLLWWAWPTGRNVSDVGRLVQ